MKNLFRSSGIALLTVVYCVAISLASDISQNSGFAAKANVVKEKNDLSVSQKLFVNTSEAENLASPISNSLPASLKESKNNFFATVKIRELFFAGEFAQYILSAGNFLIKYRKANIIFPFHYFW